MRAATYIGRAGGLAVALGVGAGAVILAPGTASAAPQDTSVVSEPGDIAASDDRRSPASRPGPRSRSAQPASEDSALSGQVTADSQRHRTPRGRAAVQISPPESDTGRDSSPALNNPVPVAGAAAAVGAVAPRPVGEELVALPPDSPDEPVAQAVVAADGLGTGPAPGGPEPVFAAPSSSPEPAQASTVEVVSAPSSGSEPGFPGQAAVSWVMVAAARRELGIPAAAQTAPATAVPTEPLPDIDAVPSQPLTRSAIPAPAAAEGAVQALAPVAAAVATNPIAAFFEQIGAFVSQIVTAITQVITQVVTAITNIFSPAPANKVPVAAGSPTVGTPDSATGVVTGTVTATDPDGDTVTYSAPATTAKGTISIDSATGEFTYTPTAAARHAAAALAATQAQRTDTITVTATDDRGGKTTIAVAVAISPANADPVAGTPTVGSPNDSTGVVTGALSATDADGDSLTFGGSTATSKGAVVVAADGGFTYTPTVTARQIAAAEDATATDRTDTFTVTVTDGHGGTTTAAVNVVISPSTPDPVNSAPVAQDPTVGSPDASTGVVTGAVTFTDTAGRSLTYSAPTAMSAGGGTVTINRTTGAFTYTPTQSQRQMATLNTTDSFTVTATNGVNSTSQVVTVAVDAGTPVAGTPISGKPNTTATVGTFTTKTTANGLGGNDVRGVYVSGNTVYAATNNGVSISTNGGTTFTNHVNGHPVNGVYASGSNVYAATGNAFNISTDGGKTFTRYTSGENGPASPQQGVYVSGGTIYVATFFGGLNISTDGGQTFTTRTTANGLGGNAVQGVYASGSTVYAATWSGGLSISTDGGQTFTTRTTANGLGSDYVGGVYASGNTVYAATNSGLSISTNGGTTFTNYTTANGLGSNDVRGVYATDSTIYAATNSGLSISTNGGTTFTNYTTANGLGDNLVQGVYAAGGTVYAATNTGGLGTATITYGNGAVAGFAVFTDTAGRSLTYSTSASSTAGGTVSVNATTGAFTYLPTTAQRQSATGSTTDSFIVTASNGVRSTTQIITVAVAPE